MTIRIKRANQSNPIRDIVIGDEQDYALSIGYVSHGNWHIDWTTDGDELAINGRGAGKTNLVKRDAIALRDALTEIIDSGEMR